ncbi:hypothetical protein PGT21_017998 [Puccinia graminis f. sp. tritici]|uniref:Uncharacterized protein n=1 Tax=Puccinia graminis f. sp. tritici TaxID=56615 RepID=A0A5B0R174_PUCGR|nr:hypothetical protein PGT21_017998 [Puccinia graminis f. sp. tritici]
MADRGEHGQWLGGNAREAGEIPGEVQANRTRTISQPEERHHPSERRRDQSKRSAYKERISQSFARLKFIFGSGEKRDDSHSSPEREPKLRGKIHLIDIANPHVKIPASRPEYMIPD